MAKISILIVFFILFIIIVLFGIYHSTLVFTLLGSILVAFITFVVSHWFWNWFTAPKIRIMFPKSSNTIGVKQPQTMRVCQQKQTDAQEGFYGMYQSDYFQPVQSTTYVSGTIVISGKGYRQFKIKKASDSDCQEISIFVLEVKNEGMSAARNSLLFFRINDVTRICKWNSVPEPTLGGSQHFYDVHQRLTLLQNLSDRAAFVFRFSDDPPFLLRQYDLTLLYGSNPISIESLKQNSNMIDCRNDLEGELLFYSEDYQGKCSILFSYSGQDKKIKISLSKIKAKERGVYRQIMINESKSPFEIAP